VSVDLIIHAGTKFALHQWLSARSLGTNIQDADPESETFGEWIYTHDVGVSLFHYWNHPSGKIPAPSPIDEDVSWLSGFYARLSFSDVDSIPATLTDWVANNTATSILETFSGVGGEGVTIVNPEDVYNYLEANELPKWGGLLGVSNRWSDPALWAFSSVMTGDQRDFDGQTYESLIDFNVWTPTQYPQGWQVVDTPPTVEWQAGTTYAVGDEVEYQGVMYRCLQAHTAIVGWQPPNVPALWQVI